MIYDMTHIGFAPTELAHRIDDCGAKLILTASCGIEGDRYAPYQSCMHYVAELTEWSYVV